MLMIRYVDGIHTPALSSIFALTISRWESQRVSDTSLPLPLSFSPPFTVTLSLFLSNSKRTSISTIEPARSVSDNNDRNDVPVSFSFSFRLSTIHFLRRDNESDSLLNEEDKSDITYYVRRTKGKPGHRLFFYLFFFYYTHIFSSLSEPRKKVFNYCRSVLEIYLRSR